MNLQEMNDLISGLSLSKDNFYLCEKLEEISKSENFKEGKISGLLVNEIIIFSKNKYFFDTISIIVKILNSKYYSIGLLKENDIIDILYMNKGQGEVIYFKIVSMVMRKISSIKPNNIKKFLFDFLGLDLEKNDFVLKVKINRMIEENKSFKSVLSSIIDLLLCDDFYNGLINDNEFETLLRLKNNASNDNSFEFSLFNIISIFESGIYSRGLITKAQIDEIINYLDKFCTRDGFITLLISDIYKKGIIKYEDIKFMLDDKYLLFKHIILNILEYIDFSFEEKECYILALLKMDKKDELCNLCNRDIKSEEIDKSSLVWEYACNFVRNILPSLALEQFAPRKRVKKLEELVDGSQES